MGVAEPPSAQCWVFTFKEGLLSAVAHDLKIEVERFRIVIAEAGESLYAEFDASSLRVMCAMRDGRPAPELSRDADKSKIESEIRDKVLRAGKHPRITFASSGIEREREGSVVVRGNLNLCGVARDIEVRAREDGDDWLAEATLHQPDFGIQPYTALFGTLKIRPDVRVVVRLPRARV